MPNKPKRRKPYPKKTRHTAEKVEAQSEAKPAKDKFDPFDTFYHVFLPKGSTHFMHTRFDERFMRMETKFHLTAPHQHLRIVVSAPWLAEPEE